MKFLTRFLKQTSNIFIQNDRFLAVLEGTEVIIAKILSICLVLVTLVSVYELVTFLIKEIFLTAPFGFSTTTLIEVFGLFLNILIALELLENVTAYLKKHVVHVELVVGTALIAIARKIIVLDPDKAKGIDAIGLGMAVLAISLSYWIIRRITNKNTRHDDD